MISGEGAFDDGGPDVVDGPVGADSADDGGVEALGVGSVFEDGSHEGTAKKRRNLIRDTGGFAEDLPVGGKLGVRHAVALGDFPFADDADVLVMGAEIPDEVCDGGLVEESDGETGGIRGESENVKMVAVGVFSEFFEDFGSLSKGLEESFDFGAGRFVLGVGAIGCEKGEGVFDNGWFVGPEDTGGVADSDAVFV